MQIVTDFHGGNVCIDRIEGDDVYFQPDGRDTEGYWFYWYFAVQHAAGRTLRMHPAKSEMLTHHAPACSVDGGWTWQWLDPKVVQPDQSFTVQIPHDCSDYRLSMAMPYVQQQLDAFARLHHRQLRVHELCCSDQGNTIPYWQLGPAPKQAAHRVILTARHHCCEMMASYVMEGILQAAIGDRAVGQWWQQNVSVTVIPFVDFDGVAAGDQGKNRKPRDHNRDYDDSPIYPQTHAIKAMVSDITSHGSTLVIDLHCPWIAGKGNEELYMVGLPGEKHIQSQHRFSHLLHNAITGSLPYDPKDDIPYGTSWNTASSFSKGCSFTQWCAQVPNVIWSGTFEIPYALVHETAIEQDNARHFGRDVAAALQVFLTTQM